MKPAAVAKPKPRRVDDLPVPEARRGFRRHLAVVAVLTAFVGAAAWIPTLAPVSIWDDWVYALSVERSLAAGTLVIHDLSAAVAVFPIAWGALFSWVLSPSLGVLRLSTVVLFAGSGVSLYALARRIGVAEGRSAFAVALYLFNPLAIVLAFTFMTDAVFMSLLVVATHLYVIAFTSDRHVYRWLTAASVVTALAFLTRQHGVFIILGVLTYLVVAPRSRLTRLKMAAVVVAPVVVAAGGYYAWARWSDTRTLEGSFFDAIGRAGLGGTWEVITVTVFVTATYVGLFLLPALPLTLMSLRGRPKPGTGWPLRTLKWAVVVASGVVMVIGYLTIRRVRWPRMPFASSWMTPTGLGPEDLAIHGRSGLISIPVLDVVTWVSVACVVVATAVVARRLAAAFTQARQLRQPQMALLIVSLLAWQAIGVIIPSFPFGGPLDRYLLPVLPLSILLLVWAVRAARWSASVAWVAVAAVAVISVGSTYDFLHWESAIWSLAEEATTEHGATPGQLDAGAAWVGYHAFEDSRQAPPRPEGDPWYLNLWGKAVDRTFVISGAPIDGYQVVSERTFPTVLQPSDTIYLLRRVGPVQSGVS